VRSLNHPAVWYLMRGSGVVALILFTAVVMLGIATTRRLRIGTMPRFVTLSLHRSVSLLACAFLALHIGTALVDSYAKVALPQLFVPYPTSGYNLYLGLGALSLDLMLAIVATSLLRHRLTQRVWKGVHWFAYGSWPLAFAHSVGMGTDSDSTWFVGTALVCLGAVVTVAAWRLLELRRPYPKYLGAPL
jgi:methionine sulfoxide reductase heme-binding subunit